MPLWLRVDTLIRPGGVLRTPHPDRFIRTSIHLSFISPTPGIRWGGPELETTGVPFSKLKAYNSHGSRVISFLAVSTSADAGASHSDALLCDLQVVTQNPSSTTSERSSGLPFSTEILVCILLHTKSVIPSDHTAGSI